MNGVGDKGSGGRRRVLPPAPGGKGSSLDIETLLERCRQGDELAWEALVREFQARVFGLAYHYLREREEARDVAQEAFVRIYRNLDGFEMGGNFAAWALRITRNCAIDRLRHLQARVRLDGAPVDGQPTVADTHPAPDLDAMESERRRLLYRALELMSAVNREMILLKDIQGLPQREIADMLSLPLGTVKTRSSRARVELARRILQLDPSYGA